MVTNIMIVEKRSFPSIVFLLNDPPQSNEEDINIRIKKIVLVKQNKERKDVNRIFA
jgi:hypothetical protein